MLYVDAVNSAWNLNGVEPITARQYDAHPSYIDRGTLQRSSIRVGHLAHYKTNVQLRFAEYSHRNGRSNALLAVERYRGLSLGRLLNRYVKRKGNVIINELDFIPAGLKID